MLFSETERISTKRMDLGEGRGWKRLGFSEGPEDDGGEGIVASSVPQSGDILHPAIGILKAKRQSYGSFTVNTRGVEGCMATKRII